MERDDVMYVCVCFHIVCVCVILTQNVNTRANNILKENHLRQKKRKLFFKTHAFFVFFAVIAGEE